MNTIKIKKNPKRAVAHINNGLIKMTRIGVIKSNLFLLLPVLIIANKKHIHEI